MLWLVTRFEPSDNVSSHLDLEIMVREGQWHDYKKGKKKEYREFVYTQPAPSIYYNMTNKGGKPNKNDLRALVIWLMLKLWLGKSYQQLEANYILLQ